MNVFYVLGEDTLKDFLIVKDELSEIKKGLSPAEIKEGISDIYAQASIFALAEDGTPNEVDFYKIDENGTAHIPMIGLLTPKVNPCAAFFGSAETEYGFIKAAIEEAENDPAVKEIGFDVNSPGGYVTGVDVTGRAIAESKKPTIAFVSNMAASGAYWLSSQADRVIASSPTDLIGSLGVVVEEIDRTKADEAQGITRRVYTSSDAPDKRIDTSTEEGQLKIIAQLDETHAIFAARVASGRGVSIEKVNSEFGHGGLMVAEKALKAGMIDEVIGAIEKKKAILSPKPVVNRVKTATAENQKEENMDIDILKQDHSAVYSEAVADGEAKGIKGERERRNVLSAIAKADPENKNLAAVVAEAIEQGTLATDTAFNTKVNVAVRDGKALVGENPPAIETVTAVVEGSALCPEDQKKADEVKAILGGLS